MCPVLSATSPCGPEPGVLSAYSLNWPLLGSNRPSTLALKPVYQSEPSGAASGSCGKVLAFGRSHSRMEAFAVWAWAGTARKAAAVVMSGRNDLVNRAPPILPPESLRVREAWHLT